MMKNNLRKVKLLTDIFGSDSVYYPEIQDGGYFHKWTTMTIKKKCHDLLDNTSVYKDVEVDAGLIELDNGQMIKVHYNRIQFVDTDTNLINPVKKKYFYVSSIERSNGFVGKADQQFKLFGNTGSGTIISETTLLKTRSMVACPIRVIKVETNNMTQETILTCVLHTDNPNEWIPKEYLLDSLEILNDKLD